MKNEVNEQPGHSSGIALTLTIVHDQLMQGQSAGDTCVKGSSLRITEMERVKFYELV